VRPSRRAKSSRPRPFAGRRVEVALRVRCQRPDGLLFRIEERRRGAVAVDAVDLAVGGTGRVNAAVWCDRNGVNLEFGGIEELARPCPAGRS
jgi:hypothetical protein